MKGNDEREKHKKEVVFYLSQERMCDERSNTLFPTLFFAAYSPLPSSPASPQLAQLTFLFSPLFVCS